MSATIQIRFALVCQPLTSLAKTSVFLHSKSTSYFFKRKRR